MKNRKPTIRMSVAFEKKGANGSQTIKLTQFEDGSVYLDGTEELIFEGGENSLTSAINYLEQKGYKRGPDS